MKLSELHPTRYLSPAELAGRRVVVTITRTAKEEARDPRTGQTITLYVIYVAGRRGERGVVINKTRAQQLVKAFGDIDFEALAGRRVELFVARHKTGQEMICLQAPADEPAHAPAEPPAKPEGEER